jgi:hypothetical protein
MKLPRKLISRRLHGRALTIIVDNRTYTVQTKRAEDGGDESESEG